MNTIKLTKNSDSAIVIKQALEYYKDRLIESMSQEVDDYILESDIKGLKDYIIVLNNKLDNIDSLIKNLIDEIVTDDIPF
jgi:hypothetical protein